MKHFSTRLSVIKVDDSSYYIGLQFYHSDTWMTFKHISHRYSSHAEAAASYENSIALVTWIPLYIVMSYISSVGALAPDSDTYYIGGNTYEESTT